MIGDPSYISFTVSGVPAPLSDVVSGMFTGKHFYLKLNASCNIVSDVID